MKTIIESGLGTGASPVPTEIRFCFTIFVSINLPTNKISFSNTRIIIITK
jgi:hypothetical protein